MDIPYDIGQKVLIEATITNIQVNEDKEVTYYVVTKEFGARISEETIYRANRRSNEQGTC